MDAGIGLTPEQLAALLPGDVVTIESGAELGRTRHMSGIVTRATDISVFVTSQSARGIAYVQEFSLRTGWRAGRGNYGALVSAAPPTLGADERERRQLQHIDGLWRAWSRNRGDLDALRELHEAIGSCLTDQGAHAHSE